MRKQTNRKPQKNRISWGQKKDRWAKEKKLEYQNRIDNLSMMKNFWKHIISLKDIIKKSAVLKHMNFLENIVVMKLKLI